MKYLLDTDTCIHAMRLHPRVVSRLSTENPSDVWVSVIAEAELRAGAAKSSNPSASTSQIAVLLKPLTVVDFDSRDAARYGVIRAALERGGRTIGPLDMLIAAQAAARGLVLVTDNRREFTRVPGLTVESWSGASAT